MNPKLYLTFRLGFFFSRDAALGNSLPTSVSTDKIFIIKIGVNRYDLNEEKFTKGSTTAYLFLPIGASGADYRLPAVSVDRSLRSFLAPSEISGRINTGLGSFKWALWAHILSLSHLPITFFSGSSHIKKDKNNQL